MIEKVSVIIPSYNRAKTIRRAVDSVLSQTFKDLQVIVVDDGSSDNTEEVMEFYKDIPRVTYIKHPKNFGACAARNTGISAVEGAYTAFLDSDDCWLPEKVEKQMAFLKEQDADIVFCSVKRIDKNGEELYPKEIKTDKNTSIETLHRMFLRGNFISTGMFLGKSECFKETLFDESLPRLQDWDIAIRLSAKYKMVHLHEPLAEYYIQADSISMNHQKLYQASKMIFEKYYDEFKKDPEAYANICETIAISMIMIGNPDADIWLSEARKHKKTMKNTVLLTACRLGLNEALRKYEYNKLQKRCR